MNRRVYPLSPQAVKLETNETNLDSPLSATHSLPLSQEVDMNPTNQASRLYSINKDDQDDFTDDVPAVLTTSGETQADSQPTIVETMDDVQPLTTETNKTDTPSAVMDIPDFSQMKPGAQLRYMREQNNLSVESVADRLYLNYSVIQAIEADDYTRLPSRVFVRGYIRSYAKLLEIPAEPLLESFGQAEPSLSNTPPLRPQVKQRKQMTSRDSWVIVGTVIIICILMILMALWRIYPEISLPSSGSPSNEADTNNENASLPANVIDANGTAIPIPVPLSGNTATDTVSGEYNPPSETGGDTENTTATATDGKTTSIPIPLAITPPTSAIAPATPIIIQPNAPTETSTSTLNPNVMKLKFAQGTWIEVRDSSNKILFGGTAASGSEKELTGTPPFKFKVGNTHGITIEYNGETINSTSTPVKVQRRFSLGTAPTTTPAPTNNSNSHTTSTLSREQATTRPSFE
ncbi:RodZ domain-containing protein [Beggiatoa leptomitoformis]|uniref:DUF4115 domain-containing protein n=1 Tax=Beggiatoa leptomitoformis TaxID=288004 RepID=A0A2N9YI80_9GAMM|nr:RodZ domain-containing protein [Beggiatoa leptomitoformis]ALG67679.1 DUF4115 domain-containing protein [Beggiatoa leptomitoformis]AUI70085.1 DUF4115 domain-containing protein [Beggiatoa leptomitoformis]